MAKLSKPNWTRGTRHLRRDPLMRGIIARVGPCGLSGRRDYFLALCHSIYSQQISTVVAAKLFERFCAVFPRKRPTPALVLAALKSDSPALANCGLSRQKRGYLLDLSQHFVDNRIPSRRLAKMSDEEVIIALTAVKGIGRWTAEMFLIFVLNRPDILPVGDFGLQSAFRKAYAMRTRPTATRLEKIAEPWRPHRTLATWYLWRSLKK